ncbi:MAG: acyl carrier protein [Marmoricola sp.]
MSTVAVEQVLADFLNRIEKMPESLTPDLTLYADGIGLDSLDAAELSAVLEDELGSSPFDASEMPETVGAIIAFYGAAAAS